MVDDGSAATAMLGLPGFVLIAVSELEDEIEQAVQTTADMVGCTGCGAVAVSHGRRPVRVRDLPSAGRAVTLIWLKRLWRCEHVECDVNTWSERSPAIRPRSSLTERARKEACRRVGRDGHTVSQVAAQFGVGWATIMKAVTEYGRPAVDDPARLASVSHPRGGRDGVHRRRSAPVDDVRHRHRGHVRTYRQAAGCSPRSFRESVGAVDL